jgi:O-antigen/teichoic acid export membrane protein
MARKGQTARSITSNWIMLAVNIGVAFFLAPYVVKHLGGVYYGIWALANQFIGYLYLLDFGVRESVIRYTAKYVARSQPRRLNQVLSTAILLYLPIAGATVLVTLLVSWGIADWFHIPPENAREARIAIIFMGLTIAQTFIFNVFTGILQGLNRFDIGNRVGLVSVVVRTVAIVFLLGQGYKLAALAAVYFALAVAGGLVCAIFAIRLLRAEGIAFHFHIPVRRRMRALAGKIFGYGFFVLVNNLAQKIIFASDAIIIGSFLGVAKIAPYAIAGTLIDNLRSLMVSTAQVFSPLSSGLFAQRRLDELRALLIRGGKLSVVITLPIAITFACLGDVFVQLWMGDEFRQTAGQILLVLGLTQIISAPHYVVSSVMYGMSQHNTLGYLRIGEAALNLAISLALVRKMGVLGVAIGMAVSHLALAAVMLPMLITSRLKMRLRDYWIGIYGRTSIAVAPFVAGVLLVREFVPLHNLLQFFACIGALCVVYLAGVWIVALSREERAELLLQLPGRRTAAGS